MSRPTSTYLEVAKLVLWYIWGILHHGISFTPGPLTLTAFSDIDWASDPIDCCSTTGLLVSWSLSYFKVRQKAEYFISFSHRDQILGFSHHSCRDLLASNFFQGFANFLPHVHVLWWENISAIVLSANPVFHSRIKHMEVDFYYVCEKVLHKDSCVHFVSGKYNFTDIFTKPLPTPSFLHQQRKLLVDSSSCCLREDVADEASFGLKNSPRRKKKAEVTVEIWRRFLIWWNTSFY